MTHWGQWTRSCTSERLPSSRTAPPQFPSPPEHEPSFRKDFLEIVQYTGAKHALQEGQLKFCSPPRTRRRHTQDAARIRQRAKNPRMFLRRNRLIVQSCTWPLRLQRHEDLQV